MVVFVMDMHDTKSVDSYNLVSDDRISEELLTSWIKAVVKQRCSITKLQPTYNLKIALNFINVRSFEYQLNFFTLDFFKGYYFFCNIAPNFPPVLVMELLRDVPSNFQRKGLYLCCLVGLHQNTTQGH